MDDNKKNLYRIETCKFKRKEDSAWENGILINDGAMGFVDCDGHKLEEVWDWRRYRGFSVDFLEIYTWLPLITKSLDTLQKLIIK